MTGRQEQLWDSVSAGSLLSPLETKAIYVSGLARHLLESAGLCLRAQMQLAAYLLAMDAAELIGAVVIGRKADPDDTAISGLGFVLGDKSLGGGVQFAATGAGSYTIRDCVVRRHFAAHGARSFGSGPVLDSDLTTALMCGLVSALDRWWRLVIDNLESSRDLLALVDIVPLSTAGAVVFVPDLVESLVAGATPGGSLLFEQHWRGSCG